MVEEQNNGKKSNGTQKTAVIIALIVAIAFIIAIKSGKLPCAGGTCAAPAVSPVAASRIANEYQMPMLIEIGAGKCMACRMMTPVLAVLEKEYAGSLKIKKIDIQKQEAEARAFNIEIIPTQIFVDKSGKELFRHEGFFSKDDILKKWKELGIELKKAEIKSSK
jgi:thioredoxin 1